MTYFLYIFKWVLYSSVLGSILACIILLFKLLFKDRLGVRWHYCIWFLLLIRLIIPYAPKSSLSVFNMFYLAEQKIAQIENISDYTITKIIFDFSENESLYTRQNKNEMQTEKIGEIEGTTQKAGFDNAFVTNNHNFSPLFKLGCFIWLIGVIIFGFYTSAVTIIFGFKLINQQKCTDENILKLLRKCKNKVDLNNNITILNTDLVKTPGIFGFIRPKLLLPIGINKRINYNELQYIIFHELSHLKRKDIIVNCVTCILQVLHWFNPIIWYSFYRMRQDREVACDALALSYVNADECIKYGQTIIKLLQDYKDTKCVYGMTYIINNKSEIKRRITMISLFKKNSYKWSIIPIAVLVLMGCIMLTNPKNKSSQASNNNQVDAKIEKTLTNSESTQKDSIERFDVEGKHFKGSLLVIHNPEKVKVGFDKNLLNSTKTTSEIAKENNAICAINAGSFSKSPDKKEFLPKGVIIHDGNIIYNDSKSEDFKQDIVGFTNKAILVVGKYSLSQLKKLGIKEAISFGPALIVNGKPTITEGDGGWGVAPRTAIGQKKDGTILFLVIDGRSTKSLGATLRAAQDILLKCGAVNASNLDGGASSTMYYNGKVINHPSSSEGERAVTSTFMVN